MKFKFSFKVHSDTLTNGSRYIIDMPGLITIKAEDNYLACKLTANNEQIFKYVPKSSIMTGWNDVELTGDDVDIKLNVNEHIFSLFKTDIKTQLTLSNFQTASSGYYSSTNYFVLKDAHNIGLADTWEQQWHLITNSDATGSYNNSQYICSGYDHAYCDFGLQDGYWNLFLSSNGSSWDIVNGVGRNIAVKNSTEYLVNLSFDGTKYVMKLSEDLGKTWIEADSFTSSTKVYNISSFKIGNSGDGLWPWKGSIIVDDYTYIKINGQTVFSNQDITNFSGFQYFSNFANNNYLMSKAIPFDSFELVNTKIVGDNVYGVGGVYQGFSGSSYLASIVPFSLKSGDTFEFKTKIKTSDSFRDSRIFSNVVTDYSTPVLGIGTSGNLRLWLSSNGTNWNITSDNSSINALNYNTEYYIKLVYNLTNYQVLVSTDDVEEHYEAWITVNSGTLSYTGTNSYVSFGATGWSSNKEWFNGTIDLKETYIKINDDIISCGNINSSINPNNWELELEIISGNSFSTNRYYLGKEHFIDLYNRSNHLAIDVGNGSSWENTAVTGTYDLQVNTHYWIKYAYNNGTYTVLIKDENSDYQTDITSSLSNPFSASYMISIGRLLAVSGDSYAFNGEIKALTVKSNDIILFDIHNDSDYTTNGAILVSNDIIAMSGAPTRVISHDGSAYYPTIQTGQLKTYQSWQYLKDIIALKLDDSDESI